MTTITDDQFETIKDRFRDYVTLALYDAAKITALSYDLSIRERNLCAKAEGLFDLFKATGKLCKQSLARMGVTAIGDELLWPEK